MGETETALEQAERHVREGEDRIARQEALIAELEQHGHDRMLPSARELLVQMHAFQKLGREHIQRELAKLGPGNAPDTPAAKQAGAGRVSN